MSVAVWCSQRWGRIYREFTLADRAPPRLPFLPLDELHTGGCIRPSARAVPRCAGGTYKSRVVWQFFY